MWRGTGILLLALLLLLVPLGCIDITIDLESRNFICVVDGDTLFIRDTTGVKCAPVDTIRISR